MDATTFNAIFHEELVLPLRPAGIDYHGKSLTLRYVNGLNELRLVRLGGRLARPGAMVTALCFRHTFLRPTQSDDPNTRTLFAEDFSRKLTFSDFRGIRRPSLPYVPENKGHWRRDEFPFGNATEKNVRSRLRGLERLFRNRILPWAVSLTPQRELAQIKAHGEDAWCEIRWIEDYERFLSGDSGST